MLCLVLAAGDDILWPGAPLASAPCEHMPFVWAAFRSTQQSHAKEDSYVHVQLHKSLHHFQFQKYCKCLLAHSTQFRKLLHFGLSPLFACYASHARHALSQLSATFTHHFRPATTLIQGAYLIAHPGDASTAYWSSIPTKVFWPMLVCKQPTQHTSAGMCLDAVRFVCMHIVCMRFLCKCTKQTWVQVVWCVGMYALLFKPEVVLETNLKGNLFHMHLLVQCSAVCFKFAVEHCIPIFVIFHPL